MAWEDKTPFEAIAYQFNLTESDTIKIMRSNLKSSSFKLWRKRVHKKINLKHASKRSTDITRFRSKSQRSISLNKISKR